MQETVLKSSVDERKKQYEEYCKLIEENGTAAPIARDILNQLKTDKKTFNLIHKFLSGPKTKWDNIKSINVLGKWIDYLVKRDEVLVFHVSQKKASGSEKRFKSFEYGMSFSMNRPGLPRKKNVLHFLGEKKFIKSDVIKFVGNDSFQLSKMVTIPICSPIPEHGVHCFIYRAMFTLVVAGSSYDINVYYGHNDKPLASVN